MSSSSAHQAALSRRSTKPALQLNQVSPFGPGRCRKTVRRACSSWFERHGVHAGDLALLCLYVVDEVLSSHQPRNLSMQVFGNVATQPERKTSKTTGKKYTEFRMAESQKGVDTQPTWYSVRVMRDEPFELDRGDFLRVTGKLKADYYMSREGKPTGTLLILAFEAVKISKPTKAVETSQVA